MRAPGVQLQWQMPCWLLFLAASCQQLTHSTGGSEHLLPQGCSVRKWGWQGIYLPFFHDSSGPACVPRLACWSTLQESKSSSLVHQLSYSGKPHIGGISLTLRRQRSWTTSWKILWTGLKLAWLEQKLCREKPKTWRLMSNCDGSLLACALLAVLLHAAVEPRGCQAVLPAVCGSLAVLWSQTPLTDWWWLKAAAVWLWESQIIKLPVTALT